MSNHKVTPKPRTCGQCVYKNSPMRVVKEGFCGLPGRYKSNNDACAMGVDLAWAREEIADLTK